MWSQFTQLWDKVKKLVSIKPVKAALMKALPAPPPKPAPEPRQEENHPCPAYMSLKERFRDIGRLAAIGETLGRDFLTMMPQGGQESRLGQIAFLFRRMHEDLTHAKIAQLLDEARAHEYVHPTEWDKWDRANLREMEAVYTRHCLIGGELMEQKARLEYIGRERHQRLLRDGAWDEAKDFLQQQIDLNKRIAEAQQNATGQSSAYEVLMQNYLPGMTLTQVETLFSDYKAALDQMMPDILKKQDSLAPPLPLTGHYPADAQMWLNRSLLHTIHFDFDRGGLYETGHNPVEGGTPDDTRLVIKGANEADFLMSMKSALHEGGHGIYIQGLPRKTWRYQPVGQDLGAAIHESQALIIDMLIGRSAAFFDYLAPRVEGLFHTLGNPELSAQNLYRLRTHVKPTMLRRHADEVTYFNHVLMRFNLEKQMFDGTLSIADLPDAWSAQMKDLIGIAPENPRDGILQDVHWFVSKFGYFPSYAVGHMIAAQLYEVMDQQLGGIEDLIRHGQMEAIKLWLNGHVHEQGRLLSANDLVHKVTGRSPNHEALVRHIRKRYL